jgi:hypothetical protein
MPTPPSPLPSFWPVFLLLFVGMWVLVCFLISLCGWRSFAARYPAPIRPAGKSFHCSRAQFGSLSSYNNVVRVILTDNGIYFSVSFLFRAFHPPFLLPWESVKSVEKQEGFFIGSYYLLEAQESAGRIRVRLPPRVKEDLSRYPIPDRDRSLKG